MPNSSHMDAHRIYDLTVFHLFKCIFNLKSDAQLVCWRPRATLIRRYIWRGILIARNFLNTLQRRLSGIYSLSVYGNEPADMFFSQLSDLVLCWHLTKISSKHLSFLEKYNVFQKYQYKFSINFFALVFWSAEMQFPRAFYVGLLLSNCYELCIQLILSRVWSFSKGLSKFNP